MRFSDPYIQSEYDRLIEGIVEIPGLSVPLCGMQDALLAYFALADYFTNPENGEVEDMLVGLRSADLLGSALGRQAVAFAKRNAAIHKVKADFFAEQVGRMTRRLRAGERLRRLHVGRAIQRTGGPAHRGKERHPGLFEHRADVGIILRQFFNDGRESPRHVHAVIRVANLPVEIGQEVPVFDDPLPDLFETVIYPRRHTAFALPA